MDQIFQVVFKAVEQQTFTWWTVGPQLVLAVVAIIGPIALHVGDTLRYKRRKQSDATKIWHVLKAEARLFANLLQESDGHWREPGRLAPHTNPYHKVPAPATLAATDAWLTELSRDHAELASSLLNRIIHFNKWVDFYCSVKADASKNRNYEFLISSLDALWSALSAIDRTIKRPASNTVTGED